MPRTLGEFRFSFLYLEIFYYYQEIREIVRSKMKVLRFGLKNLGEDGLVCRISHDSWLKNIFQAFVSFKESRWNHRLQYVVNYGPIRPAGWLDPHEREAIRNRNNVPCKDINPYIKLIILIIPASH